MAKQILIADDEANLRRVLGAQLQRDGYEVLLAEDGEEALKLISEHHVDVVISDLKMPKLDGLSLLKRLAKDEPGLPVILITAHGTVDTAVEALKAGAFDYVTKPFDRAEFRAVVDKAARTSELGSREVVPETLSRETAGSKGRFRLIGNDPAMVEVYTIVDRVASTPSTVLITGESGTGKELIARAVHENSGRKDKPFIRVNCAAIPRDLLESELFGYEKGAFTGAVTSKPGRFELADTGTLFLDEIGEISVEMQVKLLRAIQEQEFERVGGIKTIQVDVRLVAATNSTLLEKIKEGKFREDLYYRLNVVQVRLPPLRERKGDIPLLVEHFLARFRERLGKPKVQSVGAEAMELLLAYGWPGNIRELENVIERCTLFCDGERVEKGDLPPELLRASHDAVPSSSPGQLDAHRTPDMSGASEESEGDAEDDAPGSGEVGLKAQVKEAIAKVERELIVRALGARHGNVTHTARDLKISRKSLQTKMKELGLREPKEE